MEKIGKSAAIIVVSGLVICKVSDVYMLTFYTRTRAHTYAMQHSVYIH